MPGTMSVGGLASGLDTNSIISKIMDYARLPQKNMQADKVIAQTKLAAWQGVNTRVLALQTQCDSIADLADFKVSTLTSSDESIISGSATSSAATGTYNLKVTQRAQVHQVTANQSYASLSEAVGTGTLNFSFASDATKNFSVEIDSANNTLSGIRDAINRADEGVKAVIINTGAASNPQYKLLLTGTDSGADSQFTVSAPFDGWDEPTDWTVTQAGQNALIKFGEGANAIDIEKSSNVVTDLIPGVTLNIGTPDPEKTVKIEIGRDTDTIQKSIESFVEQYNSFIDEMTTQFKYNTDTQETGTLFGDYQLQMVQQSISSAVGNVVAGLERGANALASIGITHGTDGKLVIDSGDLSDALEDNLDNVAKIFGANVNSNSSYVSFAAATSTTRPSGNAQWQVEVTRAATRSQVTASVAMSETLGADEKLTVGGEDVQLTAGMNIDDVIAAINAVSNDSGVTAFASGADGTGTGSYITFRSVRYGASNNFSLRSNRSLNAGDSTGIGTVIVAPNIPGGENGTGIYGSSGLDVAGKINGVEATGSGQVLTAKFGDNSTNPANGLSLVVTANAPMSTSVQYTKGIGSTLRDMLSSMTASSGIIGQAQQSLNTQMSDLDKMIADEEIKMTSKQEQLYTKFNAMETQLSKLQGQGSYIASMLSSSSSSD